MIIDKNLGLDIYRVLIKECSQDLKLQISEITRILAEIWLKEKYNIKIKKREDGGWDALDVPDEYLTLILLKLDH